MNSKLSTYNKSAAEKNNRSGGGITPVIITHLTHLFL